MTRGIETERLRARVDGLQGRLHAAETTLREYRERYEAISEASFEAIIIHDRGTILEINEAFCRMLGYQREELLGQSGIRYCTPDSYETILRNAAIDYQQPYEVTGIRRDGTTFPVEIQAKAILYRGKPARVGAMRDVTDQRRTEAELKAANENLEQRVAERSAALEARARDLARSNSDLEQFAWVASHDLQEPLRTIGAFTRLLAKRMDGQLDDTSREYVDYTLQAVDRMRDLIQDLLAYSRVGAAERVEAVPLDEVAQAAASNLKQALRESGAELTFESLPQLCADRNQLIQLFQNLLANAIKFRGAEPPRVSVSAEVRESEVVVAVTDNGIGISADDLERIFGVFQRLHGIGEFPGTGIGLAICRKIVERHGGRIWVESAPGEGSTFRFALPMRDC